ncbi:MAG: hypothetical protein OEY25_05475 [Candidatus Aminicenantes bacterium]|nr:hypothetical protein [Candidatus Aminicenantes bacterium]
MRQKILLGLFLFFLTFHVYTANGQFTSEEIAQRSQWEDFLKTAEIIEFKDVGEGVTKPIWLTLKKGDVVRKAVWKNPKGIQQGFLEGWQYEIAAYEMDKLLELNMIPPTVGRTFGKKKGSLQLAIDKLYSELEIMDKNIEFPKEMIDNKSDRKYITRAFDCLIGNEDRTQQNILFNTSWRIILIDHSRSFRSTKMFTEQLMYGKNGIKGALLFRRLPRSFVEKIKALTPDKIQEAVGSYLTKKEINAIIARKELLLKEIEEMIKEKGEDKVLY